jgi:hypothetical protein
MTHDIAYCNSRGKQNICNLPDDETPVALHNAPCLKNLNEITSKLGVSIAR